MTINADDHPLMRLFQKPDDENRMVVILPVARYNDWLQARPEHSQAFMRPFPANQMMADEPAVGGGLF